jgi:hypothetical protein
MEIGEKLYAVTNALKLAKVHSNIPYIRRRNRIKKVTAVRQRDNSGRLEFWPRYGIWHVPTSIVESGNRWALRRINLIRELTNANIKLRGRIPLNSSTSSSRLRENYNRFAVPFSGHVVAAVLIVKVIGQICSSPAITSRDYMQPRIRRSKQCEWCASRVTTSTFAKTRLERVAHLRMKRHYLL